MCWFAAKHCHPAGIQRWQGLVKTPCRIIPQRNLCANNRDHRNKEGVGKSTASSTTILFLCGSVVVAVGGYFLYTFLQSSPRSPKEDALNAHSDGKFSVIANKTKELCQDYLSIVADAEKVDSLQRIDHLVSMSTNDRLSAYQREWNAISMESEGSSSMSERNRNFLKYHFLNQQKLVRLLTCSEFEQKGSSFNNICSELVRRSLSEEELEEAKSVARSEFEILKERVKQSTSQAKSSV